MKVFKYLLGVLLVLTISFSVYVLTLETDYKIVESEVIDIPEEKIIHYIKNQKEVNPEQISIIKVDEDKTKLEYSFVKKLSFLEKIDVYFLKKEIKSEDGIEKIIEKLKKEFLTYHIEVEQNARFNRTFYIMQEVYSNDSYGVDILNTIVSLRRFAKDNGIKMSNQSPFVIESTNDDMYNVYLPVNERVYFSKGSDIHSGEFKEMAGKEVVFKGDYALIEKAVDMAEEIKETSKIENEMVTIFEVSNTQAPNTPSEWVTKFFIEF